MTGDIDAGADVIGGALVARTLDAPASQRPDAGRAEATPGGGHHADACLNCGTALIGPHCHRCGQSAHVHRTVGAIGHEIAHGVFHFEGKVWRTLPMLVLHPGQLTRRYVEGERVRFVSPLALFLFTVFLLFATISWVGGELRLENGTITGREQAVSKVDAKIAAAKATLAHEEARHDPGAAKRIADARLEVANLQTARDGIADPSHLVTTTPVHTGWTRLDQGIHHAQENPNLALYRLQSSAYKYSWLLIPLSTPFVALLFLWRRRYGLYDHAVFVTYSLSFMMLLTVVLTLAGAAGVRAQLLGSSIVLVPPIHQFIQLRGAYRLGKFSAAWRTVALIAFSFVTLTGFVTLLLLHGLTE